MSFFSSEPKTDKELQDELRSLCDRIIANQYTTTPEMDRYEDLLLEIYKRNLTPVIKLVPKK